MLESGRNFDREISRFNGMAAAACSPATHAASSQSAENRPAIRQVVREGLAFLENNLQRCVHKPEVHALFANMSAAIRELPKKEKQQLQSRIAGVHSRWLKANIDYKTSLQKGFGNLANVLRKNKLDSYAYAFEKIRFDGSISKILLRIRRTADDPRLLLAMMQYGSLGLVNEVIEHCGANLSTTDSDGNTALHHCFTGLNHEFTPSERTMTRLIEFGIDIDARNRLGHTALFLAVLDGNINVVKLLMEAGADPNARDLEGLTPIAFTSLSPNGVNNPAVNYLLSFSFSSSVSGAPTAPMRKPWSKEYVGSVTVQTANTAAGALTSGVQKALPLIRTDVDMGAAGALSTLVTNALDLVGPVDLPESSTLEMVQSAVYWARIPVAPFSLWGTYSLANSNRLAYEAEMANLRRQIAAVRENLDSGGTIVEREASRSELDYLEKKLAMEEELAEACATYDKRMILGKWIGTGSAASQLGSDLLPKPVLTAELALLSKCSMAVNIGLGIYQNQHSIASIGVKRDHLTRIRAALEIGRQGFEDIQYQLPADDIRSRLLGLRSRQIDQKIAAVDYELGKLSSSTTAHRLSNLGYIASLAPLLLCTAFEYATSKGAEGYTLEGYGGTGAPYLAFAVSSGISGLIPTITDGGMSLWAKAKGAMQVVSDRYSSLRRQLDIHWESRQLQGELDLHEDLYYGDHLSREDQEEIRHRLGQLESRLDTLSLERNVASDLGMRFDELSTVLDALEEEVESESANAELRSFLEQGGLDMSNYEGSKRRLILQFLSR